MVLWTICEKIQRPDTTTPRQAFEFKSKGLTRREWQSGESTAKVWSKTQSASDVPFIMWNSLKNGRFQGSTFPSFWAHENDAPNPTSPVLGKKHLFLETCFYSRLSATRRFLQKIMRSSDGSYPRKCNRTETKPKVF